MGLWSSSKSGSSLSNRSAGFWVSFDRSEFGYLLPGVLAHQLGNLDSLCFYWATSSACTRLLPPRSSLCIWVPRFLYCIITYMLDAHRGQRRLSAMLKVEGWLWATGLSAGNWFWILCNCCRYSQRLHLSSLPSLLETVFRLVLNLLCSWGWPWSPDLNCFYFYKLVFKVCAAMPSSYFLLRSSWKLNLLIENDYICIRGLPSLELI